MSTLASGRVEPAPDRVIQIADRLASLLPGIYRARDDELSAQPYGSEARWPLSGLRAEGPLAGFLVVLATELGRLEGGIHALDDDHFVERASPEALVRLAELLGVQLLGDDPRINRAVIARSVGWRRRKGTRATLEEMLSVTTDWAVDVHEGFQSLAVTQDVGNVMPSRGLTADLRDPIALADPLAGSAGTAAGGAPPALAVLPGETTDDALRRLGRVDAGRPAVSPRTPDLLGWARPEAVLVRSTQLVAVELADLPCAVTAAPDGRRVAALDPLARATPLLWLAAAEPPEVIGGLSAVHEPDTAPPAPVRRSACVLTPTALAADPDGVEAAGALRLAVAGVPLIGAEGIPGSAEPLAYAPLGASPLLRFADPGRPGDGEAFELELFAIRSDRGPIDQGRDTLLLSSTGGAATPTDAAGTDLPNASVALRVTRTAGQGSVRRAAGGAWGPAPTGGRSGRPLGNATMIFESAGPRVVRPEQALGATTLQLGVIDPSGTSPWQAPVLPGGPPIAAVDGVGVTSNGNVFYLVVPDGASLALWSIRLEPAPVAERLDDPAAPLRPPFRTDPAVIVQGDQIYLFGGVAEGSPLGDLWSFSLTDRTFLPWLVRNPQARAGATLLWQWGGPVLVGGQSIPGELDVTVWRADLASKRPTWSALPPLPAAPGDAGKLIARSVNGGVEALVWAGRTRPFRAVLAADKSAWTPAAPVALEPSPAPNPPAEGEALFVGDDVLVLGPPPLPPSEVVFTLAGQTRVAFLPALDLALGDSALFTLADSGASVLRHTSREEGTGRTPYGDRSARAAGAFRLSVPGRLRAWPYLLRQRFYGSAAAPLLFDDRDDVIGLDPRIGVVVVPAGAPPGDVTATYLVGRGGAIGAGCMPQTRELPASWEEPGAPAPTPPDLLPGASAISAYVQPALAGQSVSRLGVDVPIFATPAQALAAAGDAVHPVVGILGSPMLGPAALVGGSGSGFSLNTVDPAHAPLFRVDPVTMGAPPKPPGAADDPALGVYPDFGGSAATQVWLAGLWLEGRLDLVLAAGQADLRWCTLGQPGAVAVRIPGGGDDAPAMRAPQAPTVEIRLYGCLVGAIDLPPWARLVAAGCTFDGGPGGRAIRASGAEVRLRQCTVRGSVTAGTLFASSCAFGGPVHATRTGAGWIRFSLLRFGRGQPVLHECRDHAVVFAATRPTDPRYLVLAAGNGPAALAAGELGRIPGAHGERSDRLRELTTRTDLHLPVGMLAVHLDRASTDLARMGRSSP